MDKKMTPSNTVSNGQRLGRSPRNVKHQTCGNVSPVAGQELRRVCDPYVDSLGPRCEACDAEHSFSEFIWEDTSESLDDFRIRMLQLIPESHNRIHERAASFVLLLSLVLAGLCLWYIPGIIWKVLAVPVVIFATWEIGSKLIDFLLHRIMGSVDPQIEI